MDETEQDADVSTAGPSHIVPVKVTAKMLERAEYEKNLKETADEEEEDLEVFGENVEEDYPMDDTDELPADIPSDVRSIKGKEEEEPGRVDEEQVGSRRKRPRVDPFAGMYTYCPDLLSSPIYVSLQATTIYRPRSPQLPVSSRYLYWLKPIPNAARQVHQPLMSPNRQSRSRKNPSVRPKNNNKHWHPFIPCTRSHDTFNFSWDTRMIKQKHRIER